MPPAQENPAWTTDNDEPYWISYGSLNPDDVGPSQPNPGSSSSGPQPRRVSSTGMALGAEAPSNTAVAPSSTDVPSNSDVLAEHLSGNVTGSNLGVPSSGVLADAPADLPSHTGYSSNAGASDGTPVNPDAQPQLSTAINPNTTQYSTGNPNVPVLAGALGGNAVRAHVPASGSGNEAEASEADVNRVKLLDGRPQTSRPCNDIQSFEDHQRLKKAYKQGLRVTAPGQQDDMPQDQATQKQYAIALYHAMRNLNGIESKQTRKQRQGSRAEPADSLGVKSVKEASGYRLTDLAWDFVAAIGSAQRGHLELPNNLRDQFQGYPSFRDRFIDVERALRANKNFVKDALNGGAWVNRIVANPNGERSKKTMFGRINDKKAEQLQLGRDQQKSSAAAPGTKRQGGASTDTPAEKRTRLSTAQGVETMEAQPQPGPVQTQPFLQQAQPFLQQHQPPQEQGAQLPANGQPQQPQQPYDASFQHPYMEPADTHPQYGHPELHGRDENDRFFGLYGNPHGDAQQLNNTLQPSGFPLQIEDFQAYERLQAQSGGLQQHGNAQQLDDPAPHENIPQDMAHQQPQVGGSLQQAGTPQQGGILQQQGQQPTTMPELAGPAAAAAAHAAYGGPQSS